MEESIIAFDNEETRRLAKEMKPKEITVCQDETFHPETCLVAIEPTANFIFLGKYSGGRKGAEDANAIHGALRPRFIPAQSCHRLFYGNSVR